MKQNHSLNSSISSLTYEPLSPHNLQAQKIVAKVNFGNYVGKLHSNVGILE